MADDVRSPGKLTDSPWFWLCTFASVAALALLAIGPKFRKREAQIEGNYHMRQHVERLHGQRGEAADAVTYPTEYAPLKTIDPLVWVLAGGVSVGWIALFWTRHLRPVRNPGQDPAQGNSAAGT
jgi:hypothetical protein